MISFSCRPTTAEEVSLARAWQSPALSFCHASGVSREACQTQLDAEGVFCGLFSYYRTCDECDKPGPVCVNYQFKKPHALRFFILFSPDFAVKYHSRAIEFALQWVREREFPSFFMVYIYTRDDDLLNIYKRLGFSIHSRADDFCTMVLDDRPFLDASMPLQNGMPHYEGDPAFRRALFAKKEDDGYNVSLLSMCAHTGTHIDTPTHVGLDEAKTIDLSLLNGSVQLIDWSRTDFDAILSSRVLLANARRGLTLKEAERFIQAGILLVGIDRLSVGFGDEEWMVHKSLLQSGAVILENAVLRHFSPGFYQMRCLPLSIPGSDGLPVRLLLREE